MLPDHWSWHMEICNACFTEFLAELCTYIPKMPMTLFFAVLSADHHQVRPCICLRRMKWKCSMTAQWLLAISQTIRTRMSRKISQQELRLRIGTTYVLVFFFQSWTSSSSSTLQSQIMGTIQKNNIFLVCDLAVNIKKKGKEDCDCVSCWQNVKFLLKVNLTVAPETLTLKRKETFTWQWCLSNSKNSFQSLLACMQLRYSKGFLSLYLRAPRGVEFCALNKHYLHFQTKQLDHLLTALEQRCEQTREILEV